MCRHADTAQPQHCSSSHVWNLFEPLRHCPGWVTWPVLATGRLLSMSVSVVMWRRLPAHVPRGHVRMQCPGVTQMLSPDESASVAACCSVVMCEPESEFI